MRRLLQGHLDVRAGAETREAGVRGADGVVRSHVREGCQRRLGTIFGEVEVRRCGYSAPEEGSLFPLDGNSTCPRTATRTVCGSVWPSRWRAARLIRRCARLRRPRGAKCPSVADPARRGILRPSNLRATGERLERRQDGRLDVALERVALLEHRPVRAQRVEEARPDRTCVADEDPERDREGGVRWHKSMSVSCAVLGLGPITRYEKC